MKNLQKENIDIIPIARSLIHPRYQQTLGLYLQFITHVGSITDDMTLSNLAKVKRINELEDIFDFEDRYDREKLKFIVKLKKSFVKELLVPSLFKDILAAAKKDCSDFTFETWAQLVGYCSGYSGTVARFILALYDESPSAYIPAASLFSAFQMLTRLTCIDYDVNILKRVYIPVEMLQQHHVRTQDLSFRRSSKETKALIAALLKEIRKMLNDTEILPGIIRDTRLRMQICMIISAANILFRKIKNNDVLDKDIRLTEFDIFNAYVTGIIEGMFTPYRDVSAKGLKK